MISISAFTALRAEGAGGPFDDGDEGGGGFFNVAKKMPKCKGKKLYSTLPVDLEDLDYIEPLGGFSPPSHVFPVKHNYFYMKRTDPDDSNSAAVETTLFAPTDLTISRMVSNEYHESGRTDYSINYAVCKQVSGYFYHVATLSEAIAEEFDNNENKRCSEFSPGGDTRTECVANGISIKVKAGDAIGQVGGDAVYASFDFGTSDKRKKSKFVNKKRWGRDKNVVCPLDYFDSDNKASLEEFLGNGSIARTVEPLCGSNNLDLKRTAQGNWILEGESDILLEDPHLALIYDNIDPSIGIVSMGDSLEDQGMVSSEYTFEPEASGTINRNFADVTADGQIYCYEINNRFPRETTTESHVLGIQLVDKLTLKVEKLSNASCSDGELGFSDTAVIFER